MKIAIFHNFLDNIGGAEMVSLLLGRELNADVYTTNIDGDKITRMGFADVLPRIFSIAKIPINAPWRQQAALWNFRRLNLRGKYDFFIIAGDWAMSGAVNNRPNLWFVYSPIREIWDLYEYVRKSVVPAWARPFFDIWVFFNRYLNRKYVKHVEKIICISMNTKNRVQRYLGRDAGIIYPPTETSKFYYENPRGYWLSVNRLIKHKRVDMQLKAFAQLPHEKLIIVGSYEQSSHFLQYANYCMGIKPENVEIKSWVSQEELLKLYAGCKGLIATSQDEDYGMNVVEAMAAGKPVIAPKEGGYQETVINGRTGILISDINEEKLAEAVVSLGKEIEDRPDKYREVCQRRAAEFNVKVFMDKIKRAVGQQEGDSLAGPHEPSAESLHAFKSDI